MKKLKLSSEEYSSLVVEYRQWLKRLGYSESIVYGLPNQLREYLHWLEQKGQKDLKKVSQKEAELFMVYFSNRPNEKQGGGLSIAHINRQIESVNKFYEYLRKSNYLKVQVRLRIRKPDSGKVLIVLSEKEIKGLYKACEETKRGLTDRVILDLYYGCGLRKSEGWRLDVKDVLLGRKLLHVRQSKNGLERYVPLSEGVKLSLKEYLEEVRPLLVKREEKGLLISSRGKRMGKETIVYRLKKLSEKSNLSKRISLHLLRHSIATHLLFKGLSLESISHFLGHKTLDSTQIYTHIKEAYGKEKSL